jgi:hypothetical protein
MVTHLFRRRENTLLFRRRAFGRDIRPCEGPFLSHIFSRHKAYILTIVSFIHGIISIIDIAMGNWTRAGERRGVISPMH